MRRDYYQRECNILPAIKIKHTYMVKLSSGLEQVGSFQEYIF